MSSRANFARAGELLVSSAGGRAGTDGSGYVALQTVPYRAHHLLLAAVLERTKPGDAVFEGGVSSGYFAQAMVDAGLVVDGAELDEAAAERARTVCRTVWTGDLDRLDTSELRGPYAALLFGDTLEHLADPVPLLRRLRDVLDPGGALVVSVPNVANWAMRLQLLAGRFRYTDRGILDRTHLRFYTERTLLEMLRTAGYRPVSVQGAVPVPLVRSALLCRLFHRVGNLRRSLFAYSLVVTAVPE